MLCNTYLHNLHERLANRNALQICSLTFCPREVHVPPHSISWRLLLVGGGHGSEQLSTFDSDRFCYRSSADLSWASEMTGGFHRDQQ